MFCEKCGEEPAFFGLCRYCHQRRIRQSKYIKENINKILPFDEALKFCQTLNRITDDCKESEVFGYALYGNEEDKSGIVVDKDYDIDENEWTIIMCNAKFHMSEGETGLKVKINKDEK